MKRKKTVPITTAYRVWVAVGCFFASVLAPPFGLFTWLYWIFTLSAKERQKTVYEPEQVWQYADYWDEHDTLYPGGSSSSREWRELANQAKARDGWRCVNCSVTAPLHADHIVPLSRGGPNTLANLQTLCKPCHEVKTGRPLLR